jgi:hypothetical protein
LRKQFDVVREFGESHHGGSREQERRRIMTPHQWHNVEWFLTFFANPLAAVSLLGVTGWYAWMTLRILKANEAALEETRAMVVETRNMATATKAMADTSQDAFLATLVPRIRVGSGSGGGSGEWSEAHRSIQNVGDHELTIVALKAEGGTIGNDETFEQLDGRVLRPRKSVNVAMKVKRAGGLRDFRVVVEDVAKRRREIALEQTPDDRG